MALLLNETPMPSHKNPVARRELLKLRLDTLVETFDVSTISPDPLELVLRYDDARDREVAGIIAAAFAYGRAEIIVANIGALLDRMIPSPAAYLASFDLQRSRRDFAGFAHRFHKTPELLALLERLARVVRKHGSIGALFRSVYVTEAEDIAPSLSAFVNAIIDIIPARSPDERKALQYLLTSPEDGSACKRMNLYLRWMIRRTGPDTALWSFADPAKLVIPLDTHVHRISNFLGLTKRKSADWKTAREVTDALAKFDLSDPVRYDFAICRLGILDLCSRKRDKDNCDRCLLLDVCRFPVRE